MIKCVNGCGTLEAVLYEAITIDTCNSCRGVWLDYSELSHIIKTKDESWSNSYIESIKNEINISGIPDIEKEKIIFCPKCNEQMPPVNFQYSSGVIINTCKSNHGVWLDSGELEKVQIYMEQWREKALKNKHKYNEAIADVKAQHDERYSLNLLSKKNRVQLISAIILGIFDFTQ